MGERELKDQIADLEQLAVQDEDDGGCWMDLAKQWMFRERELKARIYELEEELAAADQREEIDCSSGSMLSLADGLIEEKDSSRKVTKADARVAIAADADWDLFSTTALLQLAGKVVEYIIYM